MAKLAISGGTPVLNTALAPYRTIEEEERLAVDRVMRSGVLSDFVGLWCDEFYGGPEVRELEARWAKTFGCKHALTVNSNTSGLIAAIGAVGVSPGDEVIVPPFSMSATVVAPLFYGGIPVFADIEPETFCLDPDLTERAITPRTKAILAVNMFGHPAALGALRSLADRHGLYLIEDNAQAPFAAENNRYAGTVGHIGVFSLNYHKHFHTGEGGVCTTDDDRLANRIAMIRNHGENAVDQLADGDLCNLAGFNFRMTELSAAVGIEQLKKGERLVEARRRIAEKLSAGVSDLDGITPPKVREGCSHAYYVWAARYDAAKIGVPRTVFARALAAEGFPNAEGYVEPLYLLPMFQQRIAIGSKGFPFTLSDREYPRGLCPVAERMYEQELLEFHVCSFDVGVDEVDQLIGAMRKVYDQRATLFGLNA
jgi:dTDP-4-amino-4,6-dideoxygalactose transaminase